MSEPVGVRTPPAAAGETGARWWSPSVIGIGVSAISASPRIRLATRLAELLIGVGFTLATLSAASSVRVADLVGTVVGGLAWLGWIASDAHRVRALVALLVLAAAGGVSGAAHPTGMLFAFVATAAASFLFSLTTAVGAFAASLAGYGAVRLGAQPSGASHASLLFGVGLLGMVLGLTRRQLLERGREAVLLTTARRQAVLAEQEVQLVRERNRLGRELHDVLAHTLGTASLQLTALEVRIGAGDPPEALGARIAGLRGLVNDGLQEAREAVRALREDGVSVRLQLDRLCRLHAAALQIEGPAQPLSAGPALALYRVAQESLTNAAKHAPGAPVSVTVSYREAQVVIVVDTARGAGPDSPLAGTGGGNGIEGMRARVELAGGECSAGPRDGGWRVRAVLPLGDPAAPRSAT